MRNRQEEFVKSLIAGEFVDSEAFISLLSFLKDQISTHATKLNRSAIVDCVINQTGKARQQHFLGHMEPSVEIIV